ncbi:MAG: hypothetical protein GXO74_00985 [Calditrichaeota bacterium]|nr:hypothetical protein [Calditrichota bacterium]
MKKHLFLGLCSLFLLPYSTFAGFELTPQGARAAAMGMTTAAMKNYPESIFSNMSGLADFNQRAISFSYSRPYGMKELDLAAFTGILPTKWGALGIGFSNYGFELYQEQSLLFSFSRQIFGNFSLGANVHYMKLQIKDYGSDFALAFDVGFLAPLTDHINWGFYCANVNHARFRYNKDHLPQNFSTGISYQPLGNLLINIDIFKEVTFPAELRTGFEYVFGNKVMLRSGVISDPAHYCFGLGFHLRGVICDYGVTFHPDLGVTHQFSLRLTFPDGK